MGTPLRLLLVENSEVGALCVLYELRKSGYCDLIYQRVETTAAMQAALGQQPWDIVLASYTLPSFKALEALQIIQASGMDLPFIVLSHAFEEDAALEVMKAGAHDCILKGHLKRLVPVILRELREAEIRQQKRCAEEALARLMVQRVGERWLHETPNQEFLSILSHELRTPLTSLQASIELLQTGQLGKFSEQGQRMLEIASRNTDRLAQLINCILDPETVITDNVTLS